MRRRTIYPGRVAAVLAMVLGAGSGRVAAQWEIVRPAPTAEACKAITSALTTAPLPPAADSSWVLFTACPEPGSTFSWTIQLLRLSADTSVMNRVLGTARFVVDSGAFESFRALALDSGATVQARGAGFYGMIIQDGRSLALVDPITTVLTAGQSPCSWTSLGTETHGVVLRPLSVGPDSPNNYRRRMASAARLVIYGSTEPAGVKAAARCALSFVIHAMPPESSDLITARYVCGRTFLVTNGMYESVSVTYRVENSPEDRGRLHLPARRSVEMTVRKEGEPISLMYNGIVFATIPNGGTTCT